MIGAKIARIVSITAGFGVPIKIPSIHSQYRPASAAAAAQAPPVAAVVAGTRKGG